MTEAPLTGESRSGALTGMSHRGIGLSAFSLSDSGRRMQSKQVEEMQKNTLLFRLPAWYTNLWKIKHTEGVIYEN